MATKELAKLLRTSNNLGYFRKKIYENENATFDTLDNNETLFHALIKSTAISENLKNKYIYVLSDVGIDINAQNRLNQTCLHLAVMNSQVDVVNTLLQCSADLTIVDSAGLCAYNYARRLKDKELSKKIIVIMQPYYPTYLLGIENNDMNVIRRLVNSWCKFNVQRHGKTLIEYAIEKKFSPAVELFRSLEAQMDLCFAVMACNVKKVQHIFKNRSSELLLNFKNMKEKGSTVLSYVIRENNYDLLQAFLEFKPNVLNEYERDEKDIDYPIYFTALKERCDLNYIELLTPESTDQKQPCITNLFYKGLSVLRYAIEMGNSIDIIETLMDCKYCLRELITIRDPNFMTCKEYCIANGLVEYADLIDRISIKYIIHNPKFRKHMALNGFDFTSVRIEGKSLAEYAKENNLAELACFLEHITVYQDKVKEFHESVERNDYHSVKSRSSVSFETGDFKIEDIFITSLIESRRNNESQTVIHKAVLNGYYNILEKILELLIDAPLKVANKLDHIRDHCQRTPMHYACGFVDNTRMIQLLSQFGFSNNVFDKDGNTPLDFQERNSCKEVQDLIEMHKKQDYKTVEPNPWTWQIWSNIQRERNGLKQIISMAQFNAHGHSHGGHGHSHGGHGHSHGGHGHSHGGDDHSHDKNGVCIPNDDQCENSDAEKPYCSIN